MELDVFFEDPFWIGVFYLNGDCERFVERVVFGNEPKDGEVYNYILYHSQNLSFKAVCQLKVKSKPKNPKRMLRIIKMQALKMQYEQNKNESRVSKKKLKRDKKDYLFQLKQEKRKAKKKGH